MINYEKYLKNTNTSLVRELSSKEDRTILFVKRSDGTPFVLRIYNHEIPAYRAIEGHECAGLPRIFGCESMDGLFFVEEEYIDGVSMAELYSGGRRADEREAEEILRGLCSAVAYLHDCGFIHRDLKPEHVLRTQDGRLVIIDLDAAMKICPEKGNDTRLLGTAGYAAPEQFGFTRSDQRTDIFAIGVLLNELLTGAHPSVVLYEKDPMRRMIAKCTSINPSDRYQTAAALCADLEKNAFDDGKPAETGRKKTWRVAGAVVIIAALAVFAAAAGGAFGGGEDAGTGAGIENREDGSGQGEKPAEDTATVEGTDYLQLYKDGSQIVYYNTRQGGQSAELFTETGKKIDQSYEVYTDRNIGFVQWDDKWDSWCLVSNTAKPGESGYLHAEKDGKHYAIRCIVFPEPTSIYTNVPDIDDLAKGYLESEPAPDDPMKRSMELTYEKGKPVTLYLVAAHGFSLDEVTCDSPHVKIEEYTKKANYPFPIATLTYENKDGGEDSFTVRGPYNTYVVTMRPKQ